MGDWNKFLGQGISAGNDQSAAAQTPQIQSGLAMGQIQGSAHSAHMQQLYNNYQNQINQQYQQILQTQQQMSQPVFYKRSFSVNGETITVEYDEYELILNLGYKAFLKSKEFISDFQKIIDE